MFMKSLTPLVALLGSLQPAAAVITNTCNSIGFLDPPSKSAWPVLQAECMKVPPAGAVEALLDLTAEPSILWNGEPFWSQIVFKDWSLEIVFGGDLDKTLLMRATSPSGPEAPNWDLDSVILNNNGTLQWIPGATTEYWD